MFQVSTNRSRVLRRSRFSASRSRRRSDVIPRQSGTHESAASKMISCHIADPNISKPGFASTGVLVEIEVNSPGISRQSHEPVAGRMNANISCDAHKEIVSILNQLRGLIFLVELRCDRILRLIQPHCLQLQSQHVCDTLRHICDALSTMRCEINDICHQWNHTRSQLLQVREIQPQYAECVIELEQRCACRVRQLLECPQHELEQINETVQHILGQIQPLSDAVVPVPCQHPPASSVTVHVHPPVEISNSSPCYVFQAQMDHSVGPLV